MEITNDSKDITNPSIASFVLLCPTFYYSIFRNVPKRMTDTHKKLVSKYPVFVQPRDLFVLT